MARLTAEAERQVTDLVRHYLDRQRVEAATRLIEAVEAAVTAVDQPMTRWSDAPRPYPQLAAAGFRWIKVHRYWIAYKPDPAAQPLIHHVLFDGANIPGRIG
jgi:plasmid stabilization system protein ParE